MLRISRCSYSPQSIFSFFLCSFFISLHTATGLRCKIVCEPCSAVWNLDGGRYWMIYECNGIPYHSFFSTQDSQSIKRLGLHSELVLCPNNQCLTLFIIYLNFSSASLRAHRRGREWTSFLPLVWPQLTLICLLLFLPLPCKNLSLVVFIYSPILFATWRTY